MSDTCFICEELLSDSDVVEVRRGLETSKNSCIARSEGKTEYLKTVTFVNVHSNCRKNYTSNLSITAFERCQEEPSTSVSYLHPARYQCRFFTSSLQCRNKGVYKNSAQLKLFRRLVFKTSKMTGLIARKLVDLLCVEIEKQASGARVKN
ncbi:hypothetical protein PV328_011069 [Microctonus aethiopoides]|uniref:Uncharacterized protein n=1 Tax=Microctonus aethiopoides TaxID=144406 RepID=A0AA39C3M4_9HYME|nr:hypothetical protein PV328_011069 [Microctonus aethiopoides]